MNAVPVHGSALIDNPNRFSVVTATGLDETLFSWDGRFRVQCWSTQIVDVHSGQLLDVAAGRDSSEPCRWSPASSDDWRAGIEWATLDLSSAYRTVFDTMLPDAKQVSHPFHVVELADIVLGDCRSGVQTGPLAIEAANMIRSYEPDVAYKWLENDSPTSNTIV